MPQWLPNFTSPLAGAIAAAIVIPSLLVLYFLKLRRRQIDISSTLLWKKAIQDLQVNAPFQRLRKNLLLLLQLLILIALCLALARPVSNYTPGAGSTSVILIDRSASMSSKDVNGKSRLDEAKKRAKALVDSMQRHSTAMVIAFDDQAETVQTFTEDAAALRTAIDSIQPTDRRSRLKLAYQLAQAQIAFIPEQNRTNIPLPDVWLYSDGRVLDAKDTSVRANLKFDKIGTDSAGNVAIVSLNAKRNYERPTEVQVFARLANYGDKPVTSQVQLSVEPIDPALDTGEPAVRSIAEVSLAPDRWNDPDWVKTHPGEKDDGFLNKDSVEFNLDLSTAAVITVEQMNKEGDQLSADDVANVVIPPPKALSVLLVTDGNYYLERVIHTLGLQNPVSMVPSQYEAKVPTEFDVIVFDNYSPKELPPSGNFIYFNCIAPGLKLKPVMDGQQRVLVENVTVLDWKRDHPILKNISFRRLFAASALKLDAPEDSEVLVEGLESPLIVLHREGRSIHLAVGFDLMQSNWPLRETFVVFVQQALQYLAVGSDLDLRQSFEPGNTPRIPRTALQKADANLKSLRLNGPGASRELKVSETGDFALPAMDKVGVYSTSPAIPGFEKIAVNLLDSNESNLVPSDSPPGGLGQTEMVATGKSRLELWWWLVACGAVPVLLIEWWVYTRRVHL